MTEERLKARWHSEDEEQINAAIGALLQHPQGRKALWWLLQIGKVGQQPFSRDALVTAFACGELNVGQRILDRITSISPEGYMNMMKEMADERSRRDAQLRDAHAKSDSYSESDTNANGDPDSDA